MPKYKNQHKPWEPGVNQTSELYYTEFKELIWDVEDMFRVYSEGKVIRDNRAFVAGENVCNQMILNCDEYDYDMYKLDMFFRGEM